MDKGLFGFYKAALSGEITTPLCSEYKKAWRLCGDNKEMLMKLALEQQAIPFVVTHAYQGKGLTKEYIKENFSDYINGRIMHDCDSVKGFTYQMFVDASESLKIASDVTCMMWCENTDVEVVQTKCPTMYVSNKSSVNITLNGYNSIRVYLFDESSINIAHADAESSVLVYKYSDVANVSVGEDCLAEVKQYNKTLRL